MTEAVGYLESLSPEERGALSPLLTRAVHEEGSYLYRQGDSPRHLFIFHRGLVKVMQSTQVGRDIILEFLFPGDICGAVCACSREILDVSAVCLTEVEASHVPRDAFLRLSERYPGLHRRGVECCRRKIGAQRQTFVTMTLQKAEQRAAYALLTLFRKLGSRDSQGMHVPLPMDRENFSEMIGTTVETAIRALSRLRRKGFIQEGEGEVYLRNETALRELARI